MDKDRQIRFLYPPLIFLSSIAFGIWLDDVSTVKTSIATFFKNTNNTSVAVTILGLSSIVLVIGFLLGTLTVFVLRIMFWKNNFIYELKLKEKSYQEIGGLILAKKDGSISKKDRLYAGVVFDHGYISENIHRWIIRRWNAFFISSSSTLALFISLFVGNLIEITLSWTWVFTVLGFGIIFILQARFSWLETMRMIEFMIRVKNNENESIQKPKNLPPIKSALV